MLPRDRIRAALARDAGSERSARARRVHDGGLSRAERISERAARGCGRGGRGRDRRAVQRPDGRRRHDPALEPARDRAWRELEVDPRRARAPRLTSCAAPVLLDELSEPAARVRRRFERVGSGYGALVARAADVGVSGLIVPDLPYEESAPLRAALDGRGLALVQLVTPATPPERLRTLCAASQGFVYAVTRTGITGGESTLRRGHGAIPRGREVRVGAAGMRGLRRAPPGPSRGPRPPCGRRYRRARRSWKCSSDARTRQRSSARCVAEPMRSSTISGFAILGLPVRR